MDEQFLICHSIEINCIFISLKKRILCILDKYFSSGKRIQHSVIVKSSNNFSSSYLYYSSSTLANCKYAEVPRK